MVCSGMELQAISLPMRKAKVLTISAMLTLPAAN